MKKHNVLPIWLKALALLVVAAIMAGVEAQAAQAVRKDSIYVSGKVKDMMTGEKLGKGIVTVTNELDSLVLVDSLYPSEKRYWGTWGYDTEPEYHFKLPQGGAYKIRFDVEGYVPGIFDLVIPDKQFHKYTLMWEKDFTLQKKPKEHKLGEVVVHATRIKMVVKGDTVEYDADAFQLAEGSMLDKLLEAMPGMELRDNGEIYNNGRKVESLLVNGKDFFSGDPKMALENLPAYTVKKVQVYRKDDNAAYLIKDSLKREEMKKLVVDVKLKKEYSKGWIFNTDFAYGTHDRYSTRLAAIYYTDSWKFLGYGNLNNLNQRGGANDDGSWWGDDAPQGLHRVKTGGFRAMYSVPEKVDANLGATIEHVNDLDMNETTSATYLTSGDTYSRSRGESRNTSTTVNWNNWAGFHLKNAWLDFSPLQGSYTRRRGSGKSLSATFNSDPQDAYRCASLDSLFMPMGSPRLEAMRINTVLNATQSLSTNTDLSSHGNAWFRSPIFGNSMNASYGFSYSNNHGENFQHYTLDNKQTSSLDKQNVYTVAPSHSLSLNAGLYYGLEFGKDNAYKKSGLAQSGGLDFSYNVDYSENKNHPERYRLDSIAGWDNFDAHPLGQLPSTRDSMLIALDINNTYTTKSSSFNQHPSVSGRLALGNYWYFESSMQLSISHQTIMDTRSNKGKEVHANLTSLDPVVGLARRRNNNGVLSAIELRYNNSTNLPSMSYLLDITDDTNPLFISKGNKNLKNIHNHSIDFRFLYSNAKHMQNYGVYAYWGVSENLIGNTTTYDRTTGVTTYQPRNINGNWTTNVNLNFSRSIDKKDRLTLENHMRATYDHNVDYISDGAGADLVPLRSAVHNYSISDRLKLTYRIQKYTIETHARANWRLQNSSRANFNNVSAVDFDYGVKSNGPIVWGFEYDTNLRVNSRRGYNDHTMNDDHILWDLSLSRSFLKGKPLTLRLEMHDVLGQLTNVRNVINAQGRSETWYNSIPRYALLHVVYKFNSMKKGKTHPTDEPKG